MGSLERKMARRNEALLAKRDRQFRFALHCPGTGDEPCGHYLIGWGDWLRSPEAFQAGVEGSGWAWIPSTSAQGIVFQDASCTTCGDVLLNELIDKAKASPTVDPKQIAKLERQREALIAYLEDEEEEDDDGPMA